jgi:decaprenylphospho-beta-D-erythro-pentofuranosid-2-ulose 2-reductase
LPLSIEHGTVLIIGASSGIGRAVAEELARRGHGILVAGRDAAELDAVAHDLILRRNVPAARVLVDALAFDSHAAFVRECREASKESLEGAVVCVGELGSQAAAEKDPAEARRILETNLVGVVSLLDSLAGYFESKKRGFLCALSSVAGERGRRSNYVYGAAKAGLSVYLQGLRSRLHRSGVHVVTIKAGFVDTRMTWGRPGMFLVASPARAARRIVDAIESGVEVAYVPGFWRPVMALVRALPERLAKRMSW